MTFHKKVGNLRLEEKAKHCTISGTIVCKHCSTLVASMKPQVGEKVAKMHTGEKMHTGDNWSVASGYDGALCTCNTTMPTIPGANWYRLVHWR